MRVVSLMIMPKFYLRQGCLDIDDLENFPTGLRKKLLALYWSSWPILIFGMGLGVVAKLDLL
jgi:hypothetical protein